MLAACAEGRHETLVAEPTPTHLRARYSLANSRPLSPNLRFSPHGSMGECCRSLPNQGVDVMHQTVSTEHTHIYNRATRQFAVVPRDREQKIFRRWSVAHAMEKLVVNRACDQDCEWYEG